MGVMGATSAGSLTNLIAVGAMDTHLTLCPKITFWRFRYNRYTNFTMESIEQQFNSPVGFGADVTATMNRNGDLMYFMYAVLSIPGICANVPALTVGPPPTYPAQGAGPRSLFPASNPCDPVCDGPLPDPCFGISGQVPAPVGPDLLTCGINVLDWQPPVPPATQTIDECTGLNTPYAHYINAIGQFLIKAASLVIGGHVIDTLYNDYLFMWEELSGKAGKRLAEMIGKRFTRAQLVEDSRFNRTLYVPLPFWFTQCSGNALPMCSLQFHAVQVHIRFEELRKSIQVSQPNVQVLNVNTGAPIANGDLTARLDTTYVYLDCEERDLFSTGCFEQLITQVQPASISGSGKELRVDLNFNHPVIELIFAVRRQKQELINNWFNYSGFFGLDPVKSVSLFLNNAPRFSQREGKYFRTVQPYQHHSNIPDAFIYNYCFALHPEEPQPSGSCNFSRIDSVKLVLEIQDRLAASMDLLSAIVFARSHNMYVDESSKRNTPARAAEFTWIGTFTHSLKLLCVLCASLASRFVFYSSRNSPASTHFSTLCLCIRL